MLTPSRWNRWNKSVESLARENFGFFFVFYMRFSKFLGDIMRHVTCHHLNLNLQNLRP